MTNRKNRGNGKGLRFISEALAMETDECILWPFYLMPKGYGQVGTHEGMELAHRYVCRKAHGKPPKNKPQAAHSCGNNSCINKRHLSWKNQKENEEDKHEHGTWLLRISGAKMTEKKVLKIRRLFIKGWTYKELAERFNVTRSFLV